MSYFADMSNENISETLVEAKIFHFKGERVMLDFHLAELYGVKTKVLKQAARRNIDRFPADFMFELNDEEFDHLRSQIVTSNSGGHRYAPMAFTEHGILMLSSVLRSERAVQMNIQIMWIFTRMREALMEKKEMLLKIEQIEKQVLDHDGRIKVLFDHLKQFVVQKQPGRRIGYNQNSKR